MLVFIDDSGDPGFKLKAGSSRFFVIALVIFDDNLEAEKAALAIKELRRDLRFPDNMEFKFHKSRWQVRVKFLKTVKQYNFRVRCIVFDKIKIHSDELKHNKSSFYSYAIKQVLKHSRGIVGANIKIDGSGGREFRKQFLGYLRRALNQRDHKIIGRCKLVNSKGNVLIQMADMIGGAIRKSHEDKKGKNYKQIISKKIEDEWMFQ